MRRLLSILVLALTASIPGANAVLTASPTPEATTDGGSAVVLPQTVGDAPVTGHDALVTGVAVGPTSIVAVGQRVCADTATARARCWGQAWTSTDGSTWQSLDVTSSGLELGRYRPVLSGPEIGLDGVAYGPAGFLAFGRVETRADGQVPAVWRSEDGASWERLTADDAFTRGTRLRTLLGAADGYLLGGVVYGRTPRAAIWSSTDGQSWTRAHGSTDDHTFDIGGYIDTMEDPLSGGVSAFALDPGTESDGASLADGVLAVGQACAPALDKDPWAWNGACEGQQWTSPDGLNWQTGDMARSRGPGTAIAAVGDRLIVAAPVCWDDCSSTLLLSDDGSRWDVAYGSPVGGEVKALASMGGRFYALVAVPETFSLGPATLALWSSGEGTEWALEEWQPPMPLGAMWLHAVDLAVLGDRLLVTASGTEGPDETSGSIALLSPALP